LQGSRARKRWKKQDPWCHWPTQSSLLAPGFPNWWANKLLHIEAACNGSL
jgi:hypothetical protein